MRKLSLVLAAGLLGAPMVSQAMPIGDALNGAAGDSAGKLVSQNGAKLEFADWNMRLNLSVQDRFAFIDYDNLEGRDVSDTTDFSLTLVRLKVSGDILDKEWSYKFENDFVSGVQGDGRNGSELKDAWLQYNAADEYKVRAGQFKVPFSRQELNSDETLQFQSRGLVSNTFSPSRNQGAMLHGDLGGVNYALGVFNGLSDGEGINAAGVDNKILGAAAINTSFGEYGDRTVEGDFRENGDFAATVGAAVLVGEGETELADNLEDFDHVDVNVDAGVKVAGLSLQGEFYFSQASFDELGVDDDEVDTIGFYAQAGYMFVPDEWELAARFGLIDPDDSLDELIDNIYGYDVSLNYYINGHALKIQTGVSWVVTKLDADLLADGSDDITDVAYTVKLAGAI